MTPEELGRLFETFSVSAFRLECLPSYAVTEDAEADAFRLWSAGEEPQGQDREWPRIVRSAVARGATMQRVRLASRPLTSYQRFQMEWGYPANVAAGESIYVLDHSPNGLVVQDFWLFDNATAVVLEYDDQGRFVRPVLVATVEHCRQARDIALKSSVPLREYRVRLRG